MSRFIVVSGLPASGKSTIGAALSTGLGLPLLDKDDILEALFGELGIGDAAWRTTLSRAADRILETLAKRSRAAVVVSWWRHPSSSAQSGTSPQWLTSLQPAPVEVHCRCAAEVAVERFFARRRHAGHLDASKDRSHELARFEQAAFLGPLALGPCIEVDTNGVLDVDGLMRRLLAIWR